ncbi:MAG TPA: tRNA (guanosine(37)-N1)-methyltransferase TrmD [Clostridiales bacterium]|nr:tRNA (guanosine(37)-N1)-methyltransferase TrmD [Clostridiales bacterium]
MKIDILTLFPDMFLPVTGQSILGRAVESGLLEMRIMNIRDHTKDKHKKTDDTPYGGGAGMILSPQPVFDALRSIDAQHKRKIYMSPRGRLLDQALISELSKEEELVILCGHYEGVDQRILDAWEMEEVSIGDYILTGGELACMVLIDTVARLIPDVLGNEGAHLEESIYSGLLEYDQYTKPREYEGLTVPEVLFNGNHKLIRLWQWESALRHTLRRRPDLLRAFLNRSFNLPKDQKQILKKVLDQEPLLEEEE